MIMMMMMMMNQRLVMCSTSVLLCSAGGGCEVASGGWWWWWLLEGDSVPSGEAVDEERGKCKNQRAKGERGGGHLDIFTLQESLVTGPFDLRRL
jgi:hypothetical protein